MKRQRPMPDKGGDEAIARLYERLDGEYQKLDFGPGRKRSPLKEKIRV